jgi:hypothetical protein
MQRAVPLPLIILILLLDAVPASALEVHVKEVGTVATTVRTSIELRDVVPDRFRKVLDQNGTLHLRLQAELWESRPVWDRLVYPAILQVVRIARGDPPPPTPVTIALGNTDRIVTTSRYYVHVIATIGTLAEREADEVGDVVFGRESEVNSLGSLGRLVLRTAIQLNDYLQSVSSEDKSRKLAGSDLLKTLTRP